MFWRERSSNRLIVPALGPVYSRLDGFAEALLRVISGAALVTHGAGKIVDPLATTGMVESIGFWPPAFWAVALAVGEFFGGILLAVGFLTRPAALAATFLLLVTVYFHWILQSEGYAGAEKSILWAAICFFFVIRGARSLSVDKALRREF